MIDSELLKKRPWLQHYDIEVPFSLRYPTGPVTGLLYNAANYQANKAATWFYGTEMTFWDLYMKSTQLANSLIELGIEKGDRVGIILPSSPQFCVAYWSILMTGAIVVNLNPTYTLHELEFMSKNTGLKAIIAFDMILPTIKELDATVDMPIKIVTRITDFINGVPLSTPEEMGLEAGWYHFSQLIDKGKSTPPRVTIESEDPAVIQFTGGTTGMPKGAVLTHRNIMAASIGVAYWGKGLTDQFPPERRVELCTLPFFHVYGEICCVNYNVTTLATLVILPKFDLDQFFDVMAQFKEISYWPCVPTMLRAVMDHPRFPEVEKKFIYVGIGAAPLPLDLAERARDLHILVSEGWGMSETTSFGIGGPCLGPKKIGSAGIPHIDGEVKIVDLETDKELPTGQAGEILFRAPYVMKGYWNNPEETAKQLLPDGWLRTGDVGYIDEEGYVFIVDRVKEVILNGGYSVFPRDIDEVLLQHPKVLDAMAIGIPDEYHGEKIKAFVVLAEGQSATEEELIDHCKANLALYKVPRSIAFRSVLPRTEVGKALRRILREEEIAAMQENK